ncbi:MAG: MerR family transcriptional regulator [Crocinitomicaceae bacterium]|nr:MerR family transcriptional regulator [Crocinitomicaceae bacterium]MBK8926712.1 MerR family transcriptional regulator [Crocinitomicaceae bacterium]
MKKKSQIETRIEESMRFIAYLSDKKFTLAHIGLSDKVSFDWTKSGLYLEEKNVKGRRKYNAIEYVWLRLVKELREFGLSYDAIRNVKSVVLKKVKVQDYLLQLLKGDLKKEEDVKSLQTQINLALKTNLELQKVINEGSTDLMNSIFCMLMYETFVHKSDATLLIKKNGTTIVKSGKHVPESKSKVEVMNEPFISYPLRHVIIEFMQRENLMKTEMAMNMK